MKLAQDTFHPQESDYGARYIATIISDFLKTITGHLVEELLDLHNISNLMVL